MVNAEDILKRHGFVEHKVDIWFKNFVRIQIKNNELYMDNKWYGKYKSKEVSISSGHKFAITDIELFYNYFNRI